MMKKTLMAGLALAVAGVLGACSAGTTTSDAGNSVVEFGGQDWELSLIHI